MKLDPVFSKLLEGRALTEKESASVFTALFEEKLSPAKAKSLLLLLAKKGESVSELLGCVKALRKLEPSVKTRLPLLDTCGTGGDGSHSLNVSTLAALVIAGAGGKVAKHGNRGLSSQCGSSDVLEALGVNLAQTPKQVVCSIENCGIGYLHAPHHHPVFSRVQGLRKSLKTRTLFNLLGPMINPLAPRFQLIGVANEKTFDLYVAVLKVLKATALVCHSQDGLDEISINAPTKIAVIQKGAVRLGWIKPEKFGFNKGNPGAVKGGMPKDNARAVFQILNGTLRGPARDMVVLNAAAGLLISNQADSLEDGIQLAEASLDSGRALKALEGLVRNSK